MRVAMAMVGAVGRGAQTNHGLLLVAPPTLPRSFSPCLSTLSLPVSHHPPPASPPLRHRCPCLPVSASSASRQQQSLQQAPPNPANDAAWRAFAKCISGEWDGYAAEFSNVGEPSELPSDVVPDAFREWEVQLFDWQTQCPTISDEFLHYKLIRLLPTVGCEADASTRYSIDDRCWNDPSSGANFLAYHADGSYIAVWPGKRVLKEKFSGNPSKAYTLEGDKHSSFEVEHCLLHEHEPKFRVRILQRIVMELSKETGESIPVLKSISVHREKWESEFRDGEVLGGCSTSGAAFATSPTLKPSELLSSWHYEEISTQPEAYLAGVHQLVHSGSGKVGITSSKDLLPLPKGLWSEKSQPEKDLYSLSVGWLVDGNSIVSSNFEFSATGEPKRAFMRFKRRDA